MAQPAVSDLHVDTLLTNLSIAYKNMNYIADQIFPIVPVKKQSDIVPKYNQSYWFRDDARLRAPGTKSAGGGYTVDLTQHYYCDRYSYRREIPDEVRDNADQPFDLDREATEFVTDKLQMRREVAFASAFFVTGKWKGGALQNDVTGGTDFTQWNDYAASTPLVDVTLYKDDVEQYIGVEPNYFVIGKQVLLQLKWHPDLIETIKYTQKGVLTEELIASLLGFDKMLIGRAIYTTAIEGTAEGSVTYSRIWGKSGLMLFRPAAPSLLTPAAGYTFVWNRVQNAIQYMKRMRDEEREVDIIESNSYFAQAQTAANAGLFMSSIVA